MAFDLGVFGLSGTYGLRLHKRSSRFTIDVQERHFSFSRGANLHTIMRWQFFASPKIMKAQHIKKVVPGDINMLRYDLYLGIDRGSIFGPSSFKIAQVRPILKKATLDIHQSYRPNSNLSVIPKLLVRLVLRRLVN